MKKPLSYTALCLAALLVLLYGTRPTDLPSLMLVVPFMLMFGMLTLCVAILLSWHRGHVGAKQIRIGMLVAALPMLLLVLQSMGQLTTRDILIISTLFGLGYFYISRMRATVR